MVFFCNHDVPLPLVEYRQLGLTDAQILQRIPGLTVADLEAAWDYYARNPREIDQALWENRASMVEAKGGEVPATLLREGRRLGLTDEHIRNAFEPPVAQVVLDRAWADATFLSACPSLTYPGILPL